MFNHLDIFRSPAQLTFVTNSSLIMSITAIIFKGSRTKNDERTEL